MPGNWKRQSNAGEAEDFDGTMSAPASRIEYSEKYADDGNEYR